MKKKLISLALLLVLLLSLCPAQTSAKTSINSVSYTITAPKVGQNADKKPGLPSDAHYTSNYVYWYDKTMGRYLDETDTFQLDHKYEVCVYLYADSGYEFSSNATGTVNGLTGTVDSVGSSTLHLSYVFPALEDAIDYISEVDISIDEPIEEYEPSYSLKFPSDAKYYSAYFSNSVYKNDIFWWNETDNANLYVGQGVFSRDHTYRVTIYLTPMYGYEFDEHVTGYINDNKVPVTITSSGQAMLKYSFRVKQMGWTVIDGNIYYHDSDYEPATGWYPIGDDWYYFDPSGVMQTGWQYIMNDWYYCDPDTGAMVTGWQYIDNNWYYFSPVIMHMMTGWQQIDDTWYYLKPNGVMATGWQQIEGNWYYLRSNGAKATGWIQVGGYWFYLDTEGVLQTGWVYYNGSWYYLRSNGAMATGWIQVGGNWYYLNTEGVLQTGWLYYNGSWYYLRSNGVMATGWIQVGGNWYYLNAAGILQTGWLYYNGSWYYLKSNGTMATGWQQIDGKWYYFTSGGIMVTGTQTISGKNYSFGGNGVWLGY